MSSSRSVSRNKLSERARKRGDPREECCFPFRLRSGGAGRWASSEEWPAGSASAAGGSRPRRGGWGGAPGPPRPRTRRRCARLGSLRPAAGLPTWRTMKRELAGSERAGGRERTVYKQRRRACEPQPRKRPPAQRAPPPAPSFLLPPPASPSSPHASCLSFFSVSEVAPSAGRDEADNGSHTLAPAATSEVPNSAWTFCIHARDSPG